MISTKKKRSPLRPAKSGPARPRPASPLRPEAAGERLQKTLARSGVGSRRAMEAAIAAGRVTIGGKAATLGQRITPSERIALDGWPLRVGGPGTGAQRVLLYYKPAGEIVSRDDPQRRPSVFDHLPPVRGQQWIAIGRLDFNTSGLLIFTTSGNLANRFMHPRNEVEREYAVRVRGQLSAEQVQRLQAGIRLRDGLARVETVTPGGGKGANRWYQVVLREGRNREVRRLFEALGLTVSRLIRIRFGPFTLSPGLRRGKWEEVPASMVRRLITELDAGSAENQG